MNERRTIDLDQGWDSILHLLILLGQVPTMAEMVDMWKKENNLFGVLYSWFLAKA